MHRKDFYVGLIMLLLSGAILVQVLRSPTSQDTSGPGPFFFPVITALLMGGLSVLLMLQGLKGPSTPSSAAGGERMWKRILWIVFWCFLYGIMIETAGYLLSTGIVTFALLAYFNRGRWIMNVSFSLLTPLSIYILFDKLLKSPLPKGWLDF
ncbi:MAG: tripartite tricarboxylate transporter TctB family protein [Syntrophaceae bacterium]|nr:tripartite tricarboxylate transporter TctB family protein [Syntrophaceae bacterium]